MSESTKNLSFICLVFGFGRSSLWPDLHWGKGWFFGGGVEASCLQWGQRHHWILHWEIQERLWYLEQSQRKFSQPLLSQGIDLWVLTSTRSRIVYTRLLLQYARHRNMKTCSLLCGFIKCTVWIFTGQGSRDRRILCFPCTGRECQRHWHGFNPLWPCVCQSTAR